LKLINLIKAYIKDVARCIYIGILIAAGIGVVMVIAALVFRGDILDILYRAYIYIGCLAISVAGISFLMPKTLRPLDYNEDWERYFSKLNIGYVILLIGLTLLAAGVVLSIIVFYQSTPS